MPKIKAINITNLSGEGTIYVNQAILKRNKGIINDRYYENFKKKYEQVTLIESEKISYFNNTVKSNFNYKDFRRNIITTGIDLNKMVNKKIQINNVVLKVHKLCQPCRYLQNKLNVDNLVKILMNRGGVCAEIVQSGIISNFDGIKIIN